MNLATRLSLSFLLISSSAWSAAIPSPWPDSPEGSHADPLKINVGAEVRWADFKYLSLNSGYHYDTRSHAKSVDAAVVKIKIGPSFEQKQLEKLIGEVRQLQRQNGASLRMEESSLAALLELE